MTYEIVSVSFVRFTDLCAGLSDETVSEMLELLGNFQYGKMSYSLVDPKDVLWYDAGVTENPEIAEFERRVKDLPVFLLIDLES